MTTEVDPHKPSDDISTLDVETVHKVVKFYKFIETLSIALKWIIYGIIATVLALSQFADSFSQVKKWFH